MKTDLTVESSLFDEGGELQYIDGQSSVRFLFNTPGQTNIADIIFKENDKLCFVENSTSSFCLDNYLKWKQTTNIASLGPFYIVMGFNSKFSKLSGRFWGLKFRVQETNNTIFDVHQFHGILDTYSTVFAEYPSISNTNSKNYEKGICNP